MAHTTPLGTNTTRMRKWNCVASLIFQFPLFLSLQFFSSFCVFCRCSSTLPSFRWIGMKAVCIREIPLRSRFSPFETPSLFFIEFIWKRHFRNRIWQWQQYGESGDDSATLYLILILLLLLTNSRRKASMALARTYSCLYVFSYNWFTFRTTCCIILGKIHAHAKYERVRAHAPTQKYLRKEIEELMWTQIWKLRDAGEQAISTHAQWLWWQCWWIRLLGLGSEKKIMERTALVAYYMCNLYAVTEQKIIIYKHWTEAGGLTWNTLIYSSFLAFAHLPLKGFNIGFTGACHFWHLWNVDVSSALANSSEKSNTKLMATV